jgi:hypothetical protein
MKHNKKRNVGVVYELLLNYIAENVINNKERNAKKAIKIIERRFKKGTELYKELRIFNALVNSTVSGTHIAASVLTEAKNAVKRFDNKKLINEKSLLIKDINHVLKEDNFYNCKVKNYKNYATIQTLFNEWQKGDNSNLRKVIEYEKNIVEHLLQEKLDKDVEILDPRADQLVVNLLSKKINEKYDASLTTQQKSIIRNYALYSNDKDKFREYLANLKESTLKSIKAFKEKTDNQVLLSKINEVYKKVDIISLQEVDDSIVEKFMTLSKLKHQLMGD